MTPMTRGGFCVCIFGGFCVNFCIAGYFQYVINFSN